MEENASGGIGEWRDAAEWDQQSSGIFGEEKSVCMIRRSRYSLGRGDVGSEVWDWEKEDRDIERWRGRRA